MMTPDIKALVDRLRFIANHTHEVITEEIEEVCDAAADAIAPLAEGGEILYRALGQACIERIMRADIRCEPLGDVMLRLETVIRRSEQLDEATARAEASERDAKRYRWLREKSNISIEGKDSDWSGGHFPEQFDTFIDKEIALDAAGRKERHD